MNDRIIVALDHPDAASALACARALAGHARWVKVGMTLFYAEGPAIVADLRALGFDVFVDLKLHDIPHQVEGAARSLGRLGARMLTVHAGGGADM
ncbi:MAG: orotidine 5'-phosphate decarboxylase / HUMPS family protein, partial [Coriobacteriia bacterium]|nr:orotidine 5'-phosphate decarboxylase / HUMPS family protein [Coriobacteriia bacterium]